MIARAGPHRAVICLTCDSGQTRGMRFRQATDSSGGRNGAKRYRSLFLSDFHLGTKGRQAQALLDFLKHNDPTPSTSSAILSTVGGCAPPGTGHRLTTILYRSCCARHGRVRASSICPAIMTSSCAASTARISAASKFVKQRSMRLRQDRATWSSMAMYSTWSSLTLDGSHISETGPTRRLCGPVGISTRSGAALA